MSLFVDRWSVPVLLELADRGRTRRADLWRALGGVSQKVLTGCLRRLEARGLVERSVQLGASISVSYELTDLGRGFVDVVMLVQRWAEQNIDMITSDVSPQRPRTDPCTTGTAGEPESPRTSSSLSGGHR